MYGGVETVLATLAGHQALTPEMVSEFGLCYQGRLWQELAEVGAVVHDLGVARVSRPVSVLKSRRRLRRLLQSEHFDTVSCHSSWAQTIFGPVVRNAGVPLVFWLHDAATGRGWLERLASRVQPDVAVCNSRFTAGTLRHIYRDVWTEVVHCPVPRACVAASRAERAHLRAALNTPPDSVVIIQVSRMEECKGHRLHLESLALLRDVPGWICWQVGGPQREAEQRYFDELVAMAGALGISERVRFLGQRTDVAALLAASDVFCQPNTGPDAFGITFVEALYAGVPVVTTALGGGQEVVTADCGVLVPPADQQGLAAVLATLMHDGDLRRTLGAHGPARARALSDPGNQMVRLQGVLHGAAERFGSRFTESRSRVYA